MPASKRARYDKDLGERLHSLVLERDSRSVAIYHPMSQEPDLLHLARRWRVEGRITSLPVMQPGHGQPAGALVFGRFDERTRLEQWKFGVFEPVDVIPVEPDLVVAPCVGFHVGREGLYRLGYGGGYYDRTHAWRPVNMVGVAYDEVEVRDMDPTATDAPLSAVITPSRSIVVDER